jgi:hypothetical protein
MLDKQQTPAGQFLVHSHALMDYMKEICESVLNISLRMAAENEISRWDVTSYVTTVDISRNRSCLLIVNCDDKLLDFLLKTIRLRVKDTLYVLKLLSKTISESIAKIFRDECLMGLFNSPIWLHDGVLAEGTLKHDNGCIHLALSKLVPCIGEAGG